MGLTDAGINQTRAAISELQATKNKLTEDLAQLQNVIKADANFQKFVEGTPTGARDNELVMEIIKIANESCSSTDGVISTTQAFLDEQHADNVRKAQLQAEQAASEGGAQ